MAYWPTMIIPNIKQTFLNFLQVSPKMVSKIDVIDSRVDVSESDGYKQLLKQFHMESQTSLWKFETVPHIFKQSSNDTDDSSFDYLKEDFGIEITWKEINKKLKDLNEREEDNDSETVYKVLILARHGQGYHNVAHEKYGNDAWNDYWSKLNGDGEMVWGPDAELTELGRDQARDNAKVWKKHISTLEAPIPTKFYSSPLSRSIDTLILTWEDIVKLADVKPLIKENIRETIGVHTCDKRSTKSILESKYSGLGFQIEDGFEEEDIYFKPDERETVSHHALRLNKSFQEIFNENGRSNPVICITSHSGSIRASLLALGHREFSVGTGGLIPVFVKATKTKKSSHI